LAGQVLERGLMEVELSIVRNISLRAKSSKHKELIDKKVIEWWATMSDFSLRSKLT
jgi:hypothetical protein